MLFIYYYYFFFGVLFIYLVVNDIAKEEGNERLISLCLSLVIKLQWRKFG